MNHEPTRSHTLTLARLEGVAGYARLDVELEVLD